MKQLDMMGQPCPIPVIQARKALAAGEDVVAVTVDNEAAVQNLQKMAQGEGYDFSLEQADKRRLVVTLRSGGLRQEGAVPVPEDAAAVAEFFCGDTSSLTLLITRERLGDGAEELGAMLMKGFVFALTELPQPPKAVVFLNGGARLTSQGAATVPDLQTLAQKGTQIYTCGTCVNFFGIKEKLAVGEITDMMNIVRMMAEPGRAVTL